MEYFIYVVAAVAIAVAYFCGKVDGACLACKSSTAKCKYKHTKIVKG